MYGKIKIINLSNAQPKPREINSNTLFHDNDIDRKYKIYYFDFFNFIFTLQVENTKSCCKIS
jgi:hypothetical protein